ncbi:MAG TPA: hypothetical protein PKO15_05215 [Fibrobacteria bacterium]|nr:hypothetical protein [Fibrobacteria bacterium]
MTSLDTLEGISRTRPGGLGFSMYAEALLKAGRTEQAEQVVQEGLQRWPRSLTGRILRGKIALERGDFEVARSSFQTAVDLDGASRAALEGLAEASTRAQYLRQAFEVWGRLAALEPDHPKASTQVRTLAQSMDNPAGLDPVKLVREQEDVHSREALSEGATSLGMSSMATPMPAFQLDMGESPSASGFTNARMEAATIPELPGFQAPAAAPPPSASLLGKVEESSFATLEMPSFTPSRTIPPPPLEMPVPPSAAPTPASEFPAGQLPPPAVPGRFPTAQDRIDAEATQFLAAPAAAGLSSDRVQGDDIENRMDALFGEISTSPAQAAPQASAFQPVDTPPTAIDFPVFRPGSDKVTGGDVAGRLDELFGESSAPAPASTAPAMAVPSNQPVVSGDDIEGRLDDLFSESVIDLTAPTSEPPHPSASSDTSTMPRDAMLAPSSFSEAADTAAVARDTTIEAQLPVPKAPRPAESTAELMALSSVDISSFDTTRPNLDTRGTTRLTAEDVDSRLDELFASSEFQADANPASRRTGFVPRNPSANQNQVTGDDIEGRLDDLFGGDSDFPVGLPTVTFAEEYLRQGHRDKAASIYRQLLEKDPGNEDLRRRLADIEGKA